MTLKKAESITKLEIVGGLIGQDWRFHAYDKGKCVASGEGDTEGEALEELVNDNYQRVSTMAIIAARFRCSHCGRAGVPLQFHHVVHRSKGRVDTVDNGIVLCASCHSIEHCSKRKY